MASLTIPGISMVSPSKRALRAAQSRFNQIQKMLTGISPRALTTALRALTEVALVKRWLAEGGPE